MPMLCRGGGCRSAASRSAGTVGMASGANRELLSDTGHASRMVPWAPAALRVPWGNQALEKPRNPAPTTESPAEEGRDGQAGEPGKTEHPGRNGCREQGVGKGLSTAGTVPAAHPNSRLSRSRKNFAPPGLREEPALEIVRACKQEESKASGRLAGRGEGSGPGGDDSTIPPGPNHI